MEWMTLVSAGVGAIIATASAVVLERGRWHRESRERETAVRRILYFDPLELATQSWAIGHGLASLVATGPLPHQALAHGVPMLTSLFISAGDEPDRCRRSVEHGWGRIVPAGSGSRER